MNEPPKKSEKKDLDAVVLSLRKISVILADAAFKLGLKPNHVTLFRFFVLGIGAAICLYIGGYLFNFIALGLLIAAFILDLVDGDLARRHNLKSATGKALEDNLDGVLLSLLILAISVNLYFQNSPYAYAGLFCLFAQIFSKHYTDLFEQRFGINCVESHPELEAVRYSPTFDKYSRFYAELLAPRNFFFSLFSNFRYFLVAGILTNMLGLFLLIYTVMLNLRWVLLALITVRYAGHQDRATQPQIFNILTKLDSH